MADTKDSPKTEQTFKDKLDQEAVAQRERDQEPKPNPIVEKITEFIPAASKILAPKHHSTDAKPEVPGPPDRPVHDQNIEAFVRDVHRSNKPGGDLNEVSQE